MVVRNGISHEGKAFCYSIALALFRKTIGPNFVTVLSVLFDYQQMLSEWLGAE